MDQPPHNLSDFYSLLQQQDRAAFSSFYDQYAGALYGEIIRAGTRQDRAEEILLSVFMQAYRELPNTSFEHRHLFTWVLVITRAHLAHDYR